MHISVKQTEAEAEIKEDHSVPSPEAQRNQSLRSRIALTKRNVQEENGAAAT